MVTDFDFSCLSFDCFKVSVVQTLCWVAFMFVFMLDVVSYASFVLKFFSFYIIQTLCTLWFICPSKVFWRVTSAECFSWPVLWNLFILTAVALAGGIRETLLTCSIFFFLFVDFSIFVVFFINPGQFLTRQYIIQSFWWIFPCLVLRKTSDWQNVSPYRH